MLYALLLSGAALSALVPLQGQASDTPSESPPGMVLIPAGKFRSPFRDDNATNETPVAAFYLDVYPVTNDEFLEFVRVHPRWRRSQVPCHVAEDSYLKHWAGDLELGPLAPSNAPVTQVSWLAARAFARWKGKRLPTTAEWELAAAASAGQPDGSLDPAFQRQILDWYAAPTPAVLAVVGTHTANVYGVHDLHALVWEWTADFGSYRLGETRGSGSLSGDAFCGGAAARATNLTDFATFMRFGFRSSLRAEYTIHNLGFRCARSRE